MRLAVAALLALALGPGLAAAASPACKGTVFLTIDTGHMENAEGMAAILRKHDVKATFFLANQPTKRGDTSLDPSWAPYWKRLADEGHAFGSHTWRHWYIGGDLRDEKIAYLPMNGQRGEALDRDGLCTELKKPEEAFRKMTGRGFDAIWRAPGGKVSPRAIAFAQSCGFTHVGWTPAGFSGDELPSDRFPGDKLIARQLADIKDGDVLVWHLGIWSRAEPLWPRLDDLIAGLKAKGLCFARIPDSPRWKP